MRALFAIDVGRHVKNPNQLEEAAAFCSLLGMTLDLIHVDSFQALAGDPVTERMAQRIYRKRHEAGLTKLDELASAIPEEIRGVTLQRQGEITKTVSTIAVQYDLLIIARHRKSFFERLFVGSEEQHLLHAAPIDIMLLPDRD